MQLDNRYMKTCSTLLIIRKYRSKPQWDMTSYPLERLLSKRNNRSWGECEETGKLLHSWRECKLMQPLWKQYWGASKIKNRIAIRFSNFTLGYLSEGNTNLKTQYSLQQYLFSWQAVSDSLQPHGLQHARFLCPSLSPKVCSNSCPLNWWCYLSHPLWPTSPFAFSLSQHQGIFQRVSSAHQVAEVLELQLQHQSFQLILRVDFL